ncbi:RNA-directed DNA polymerase [Herbaspirillum sp. RV1423]|uniref:RNA-directed DNA polymerase n=1 Tax=Herbaspirillum sp. RV1423 TaxID=1443993 RepID=UPI002795D851|nr:RNA-directed DNA polymerase [Herbaspirillum sp. RV1423]
MGGAVPQIARFMEVKAAMTERSFNLVVPLAHEATDMRIADTTGCVRDRSGAVSHLNIRVSDMESTMVTAGPGIRTSTTATRTTTTRTTRCARVPSADWNAPDFTFSELVQAYFDCRRTKRNSPTALAFEANLESNLRQLNDQLVDSSYTPGRSLCFVITRPKAREVWAADFRDRIVHHLLHNHIAPRFYASFIADSCACIPGRGTLYGAKRLESKVRSITQNWSRPAHYLKCDLANFFVSINKHIVRDQLARRIHEPWWMGLAETVLLHDPRQNFEYRGDPDRMNLVPPHKRLLGQPAHLGLPIGNLSSQFFANVYLDELDQFVKHRLRCRYYIRYVDDFVLLHESSAWLNDAKREIEIHLANALGARLNPTKTILQPIARGIDFVGQVIKPWRRTLRRRTFNDALQRVRLVTDSDLFETGNSYFGLMRQASHGHHDRVLLAKELLRRGHTIKSDLTKTFRRKSK